MWTTNNEAYLPYLTIYFMNEGTIKFFNEAKGFGFITPENGGADNGP